MCGSPQHEELYEKIAVLGRLRTAALELAERKTTTHPEIISKGNCRILSYTQAMPDTK